MSFWKIKECRHGEGGFTLIELLIVIVLLGILAAAIIPNMSKFIGNGQVGAANAELAAVKTAINGYRFDNGSYPTFSGNDTIDTSKLGNYTIGTTKGVYNVNNVTGELTGLSYDGLSWNGTLDIWQK